MWRALSRKPCTMVIWHCRECSFTRGIVDSVHSISDSRMCYQLFVDSLSVSFGDGFAICYFFDVHFSCDNARSCDYLHTSFGVAITLLKSKANGGVGRYSTLCAFVTHLVTYRSCKWASARFINAGNMGVPFLPQAFLKCFGQRRRYFL